MAKFKHYDYFGQPLEEGDYVVSVYQNLPKQLALAKVIKMNEKMILIKRLGTTRGKGTYRYSDEVVKIDPKLLTMKALKA